MRALDRAIHLTKREYLPMLAMLVTWSAAAAAIGLADMLRLLAAVTLIRAVQLFTQMPTRAALRRRIGAPEDVVRKAARLAFAIQAASLATGLVLLAALVAGIAVVGERQWAALIALVAVGYPARNLLQSQRGSHPQLFVGAVRWVGAALVAVAYLAGWGPYEVAFVVGLREWIAGALSLVWKAPARPEPRPTAEPISLEEIAGVTGTRARRAFVYRLSRAALGTFVPGAGLLARTGRGFDVHRRLERFVPHHRPTFMLVGIGACLVAGTLVLAAPEPTLLVVAAVLVRVAAAAASAALWWTHLAPPGTAGQDDEEEV
jgi:hypothetical protein